MGIAQTGWDAQNLPDALSRFLESRVSRPHLLGFAEAMHGVEELPRLRNQAFQHLVEQEGFGAIAVESDCMAGLRVDRYLAEGGDLDTAVREGISHGFGDLESSRELVDWMRRYYLETGKRLRFYGFDVPTRMWCPLSPHEAFTEARQYLSAHVDWLPAQEAIEKLIGDYDGWASQEAFLDTSRWAGRLGELTELRLIAQDLIDGLNALAPSLIAETSHEQWWRARWCARAAYGLLRQHTAMADDSADRMGVLLGTRDAVMADNLVDIAERETAPVLVFAHNGHLQTTMTSMDLLGDVPTRWWSAGALLSARKGPEYAWLASAVGTAEGQGIADPAVGTAEEVMSRVGHSRFLFDAASVRPLIDGDVGLRREPEANPGYSGLDPSTLNGADGVLFSRTLVG